MTYFRIVPDVVSSLLLSVHLINSTFSFMNDLNLSSGPIIMSFGA